MSSSTLCSLTGSTMSFQYNLKLLQNHSWLHYQSNPAAKLLSIAGDMSLAALIMHLSAWDFLKRNNKLF